MNILPYSEYCVDMAQRTELTNVERCNVIRRYGVSITLKFIYTERKRKRKQVLLGSSGWIVRTKLQYISWSKTSLSFYFRDNQWLDGYFVELSMFPKQKIHIISTQPIRRRSSANSFHELSLNSVSIDVIGEFWRTTKRELVRIVWIAVL